MKNNRRIFFVFIFLPISLFSQKQNGMVVSENQPLEGVNIINKASSIGTISNFKGEFEIEAKKGDTLIFSYLGMKSVNVIVTKQKSLIVDMETDYNILEGTTVIGKKEKSEYSNEKSDTFTNMFGTQNLKNAGYTVNQVKGKDLINSIGRDRGRIPAIVFALQGKVASYRIGTNGVVLRSAGSITQETYALWEIDGQTFDGFPPPVDLNIVKDVFVIKSLAGTTLYGTRGAGGVIVVNTIYNKAYEKEKTKEIFNSEYGSKGIPYSLSSGRDQFQDIKSDDDFKIIAYNLNNNINGLRGLAYSSETNGMQYRAIQIYRKILSISDDPKNSFRDLAHSWLLLDKPLKAWKHYMYALNSNVEEHFDENIDKVIFHEMERLYISENLEKRISEKFQVQSDFSSREDTTTRIVFEWSNEQHNFSIEVLNPHQQSYLLNFGSRFATEDRIEEFFLDDTIKGDWIFNLKLEPENKNEFYLKVTIYKNWYSGSKMIASSKYFKFLAGDDEKFFLFSLTK